MKSNFVKTLERHLQLPSSYHIEQDKEDIAKIYVYKQDKNIDELIGSYIFENATFEEIFEVCKEIIGDVYG